MNWWKKAQGSMGTAIFLRGCWYNPATDDVIESRKCHGCTMVANPGRFGLTDEEVNAALMASGQIRHAESPEEAKAKLKKMWEDPEGAGIDDLQSLWRLGYDKGYVRMHRVGDQVWATHDTKPVLQLVAEKAEPYFGSMMRMLLLGVGEKESFDVSSPKEAAFFARHGSKMRGT